MTEMTVISAVTPSAIPSMEMIEMNEIKWLRRLARVYRSPTNMDSGLNIALRPSLNPRAVT